LLAAPVRADFPAPVNLSKVVDLCALDAPGVQRLREQGLVVSPAVTETNLYGAYYGLELKHVPMYITSDAMLYLWYEAHRQALMAVEQQYLRPQLAALTVGLLEATRRQPGDLARDNAELLAVVRKLLEPDWSVPADLQGPVDTEVARVMAHRLAQDYPGDDYTQYEVRGYYTKTAELGNYFRGAKYLGRRYFSAEANQGGREDLGRAVLLAAALREGKLLDLYRQIRNARVYRPDRPTR
jgi:hypothetical protein